MSEKAADSILRAARAWIEDPSRWTTGALARDKRGVPCDPLKRQAVQCKSGQNPPGLGVSSGGWSGGPVDHPLAARPAWSLTGGAACEWGPA